MLRALALAMTLLAAPAGAAEIDVAPGRDTLAEAIGNAQPGDVLRLRAGDYGGGVTVNRPLSILGAEGTHLAGTGEGSVVTVDAPDVTVRGLRITGSGSSHETIDSGVQLTAKAARARVEGNRLEGNLYGVDIHGAKEAVVADNVIVGRDDHRMNARGNGVYIWNAPGAQVLDNTVTLGRDGIFVNTSRRNVLSGNSFSNLRFAVHFMYADGSEVSRNRSEGNHLGYAIMFTKRIALHDNVSIGDRDHGIMLNYANDSTIARNRVVDGGDKCLFMYNANKNELRDNWLEGCRIGIHFTAGSERNAISGNAFVGNRTQVKYVGTTHLEWSEDGRGNYWSDLVAPDLDGDGVLDQAYRPNDTMDQVLWTQPAARFLLGSPAVQLIRWAQKTFPGLLPGGIVDSAPLAHPVPPEGGPA